MTRAHCDDIDRRVSSLPLEEKATLARVPSEALDTSVDADVEQLWLVEAQRRYDDYLKGEREALLGDEWMARARSRVAAKRL